MSADVTGTQGRVDPFLGAGLANLSSMGTQGSSFAQMMQMSPQTALQRLHPLESATSVTNSTVWQLQNNQYQPYIMPDFNMIFMTNTANVMLGRIVVPFYTDAMNTSVQTMELPLIPPVHSAPGTLPPNINDRMSMLTFGSTQWAIGKCGHVETLRDPRYGPILRAIMFTHLAKVINWWLTVTAYIEVVRAASNRLFASRPASEPTHEIARALFYANFGIGNFDTTKVIVALEKLAAANVPRADTVIGGPGLFSLLAGKPEAAPNIIAWTLIHGGLSDGLSAQSGVRVGSDAPTPQLEQPISRENPVPIARTLTTTGYRLPIAGNSGILWFEMPNLGENPDRPIDPLAAVVGISHITGTRQLSHKNAPASIPGHVKYTDIFTGQERVLRQDENIPHMGVFAPPISNGSHHLHHPITWPDKAIYSPEQIAYTIQKNDELKKDPTKRPAGYGKNDPIRARLSGQRSSRYLTGAEADDFRQWCSTAFSPRLNKWINARVFGDLFGGYLPPGRVYEVAETIVKNVPDFNVALQRAIGLIKELRQIPYSAAFAQALYTHNEKYLLAGAERVRCKDGVVQVQLNPAYNFFDVPALAAGNTGYLCGFGSGLGLRALASAFSTAAAGVHAWAERAKRCMDELDRIVQRLKDILPNNPLIDARVGLSPWFTSGDSTATLLDNICPGLPVFIGIRDGPIAPAGVAANIASPTGMHLDNPDNNDRANAVAIVDDATFVTYATHLKTTVGSDLNGTSFAASGYKYFLVLPGLVSANELGATAAINDSATINTISKSCEVIEKSSRADGYSNPVLLAAAAYRLTRVGAAAARIALLQRIATACKQSSKTARESTYKALERTVGVVAPHLIPFVTTLDGGADLVTEAGKVTIDNAAMERAISTAKLAARYMDNNMLAAFAGAAVDVPGVLPAVPAPLATNVQNYMRTPLVVSAAVASTFYVENSTWAIGNPSTSYTTHLQRNDEFTAARADLERDDGSKRNSNLPTAAFEQKVKIFVDAAAPVTAVHRVPAAAPGGRPRSRVRPFDGVAARNIGLPEDYPPNDDNSPAVHGFDISIAPALQGAHVGNMLLGDWETRLLDMHASYFGGDIALEWAYLAYMLQPLEVQTLSRMAHARVVPLPYDILFWFPQIEFITQSLLIARSNSLYMKVSPIRFLVQAALEYEYIAVQPQWRTSFIDVQKNAVAMLPNPFVRNVQSGLSGRIATNPFTSLAMIFSNNLSDRKKADSVFAFPHPITQEITTVDFNKWTMRDGSSFMGPYSFYASVGRSSQGSTKHTGLLSISDHAARASSWDRTTLQPGLSGHQHSFLHPLEAHWGGALICDGDGRIIDMKTGSGPLSDPGWFAPVNARSLLVGGSLQSFNNVH